MCVVIDLDVVCLTCLQPNKDMTAIFSADGEDPELQIAQKISILSDLKTNQSNRTLPNKICKTCLEDLKGAWRFRKNCQAAVTIFQTIVKLDLNEENLALKELNEHQIKVPHGLQIKRVGVVNDNDDERDSTVDECNSNNDKVSTTLYDELEPENLEENQEQDTLELVPEQESNENEENFVEYYITEEVEDEQTEDIEKKGFTKDNVPLTNRHALKDEEQLSISSELSERGRPKKENLLQKDTVKPSKIVRSKSNAVIENSNSSADTSQHEVREVKTRKRKSHSPEIKTPKICEICGNSYRYQHALVAHMRRHFNDKPFPCECCDKAFVSNVELRRHMRVHTGQKPYQCQYCERRFSDFGSRIKHERTHTGERPYNCVTCGKSFAYPHVLSVHLRTHTGEKKFRCEYCCKGFTKKKYLLSHVNQHLNNDQHKSQENVKIENNEDSADLEDCAFSAEMSTEVIDEEFDEESLEESGDIIITESIRTHKIEDDEEIEEIEEDDQHEYTITIR